MPREYVLSGQVIARRKPGDQNLWEVVPDGGSGLPYVFPDEVFRAFFVRAAPQEIAIESVGDGNIRGTGYDPVTRELVVQFANGGVYLYQCVPPDKAAPMMGPRDGQSVAAYFASAIRPYPAQYPYRRLA